MEVHVVDGTYELFRYHFSPSNSDPDFGATRGVVGTLVQMIEEGATHVGVATDHVVESFRNDLWAGYKSSAGMPPELLAQFPLVEEAMQLAGFTVWPQVEYEADDAMAAAAAMAARDDRVERVLICTPDKDLGQCVGGKVVQLDRRKNEIFDAEGVRRRLGVAPESIADMLGLVGDSADGFPGLAGWGAKSAAAVLNRWPHLEDIPDDVADWDLTVRSAATLSATLRENYDLAVLFRTIATVVLDAPVSASVDQLRWSGPADPDAFAALCGRIGADRLLTRVTAAASSRT